MKLRKEMVKVNDKIYKGRKCFIVSMLFMLTFFFSIGFMEQSSKADTVNYSEGDFSYQLTQETKTATLQKYTGISQSVTIPSRIDWDGASYNVTVIGQNAFRDNTTITSINIPKGVLEIDNYAFYGCSVLSSVKLPTNCQLGKYIFYECDSLNEISIPEGTTSIYDTYPLDDDKEVDQKNDGACLAGGSIEKITFESGVTKVPSHLCEGLTQLKTIEWGNVASLGYHAFNRCESLTTIELPEKLICIDGQAFKGCAIRSISLPNGLTQIGYQAFQGSELEQVVIPDSVKILGITNLATEGAFEDCEKLTSVVLGAGLQKLGGSEFQNCTSLVSVDLSKAVNIEEIPPYTFSGCSALEQIVIPSQIKKIGYGAFSNCTSLKADKVTMSENLQSMAGSVFSGCTSFTELPDLKSMTSIPEYTFSYCTGLVKVEVPDRIQTIGGQAFYNCTNLVAIGLGTGFDGTKLETWDTYIFYEMHNPSTIYTATKEQADWLTANKTDRYLYSDYTDVKVGKVPENLVIPTPKPTPTPLVTPPPTPVPKTTPTPIPTPTQKTSGTPVKTPASNAKPTTAPANTNKNPKQAVLKAPVIKKVKAGKKKVSVSWKKSAQSITGYQIQYSTSASFKKGKKTITISGKKKQSRTIKKLKTKKKYYIRIRTYQVINGKKTVSKWSKTKKFKTK